MRMTSTQYNPSAVLQRMLGGATATSLLYIAAELGLCDVLAAGPATSHELAARTSANADVLERVLRGLAVIGIVETDDGHTYSLAPLGQALRSDVPDSVLPMARLMAHPIATRAWTGLLHSVKTGENAFAHAVGVDFMTYFVTHPAFAETFNTFMGRVTAGVTPAVISAYDFTGIDTFVDVGGGDGTLLRAILRSLKVAHWRQPRGPDNSVRKLANHQVAICRSGPATGIARSTRAPTHVVHRPAQSAGS
jgi:hypothetical protein